MKILLTGSSGLIGKKLNGALKARGDEVLIAKRGTTSERNTVSWEIDRAELSGVGLSNLDAVVHLAGAPIAQKRWSPERKAEIYDSRINATRSIFQAVEKLEVPKVRFVIASAIGFYGDQGDKILDEKSPGGVGFLAKVTTDWEKAAAPINQDGWSVALARTGIVLDSRGGALA
ncbi:NAD dependent epimerase/dehydratase family protein, partial [mine drainage metagenome]